MAKRPTPPALWSTKLGKRLLLSFVLCALAPIATMTAISYRHVGEQLRNQARIRLEEYGRAIGTASLERLAFVDRELTWLMAQSRGRGPGFLNDQWRDSGWAAERIRVVMPLTQDPAASDVVPALASLAQPARQHLESGRALLVHHEFGERIAILLGRMVDPSRPAMGVIWVEIEPGYLWRTDVARDRPVCIMASGAVVVRCLPDSADTSLVATLPALVARENSAFTWRSDTDGYLAGSWSLPADNAFAASGWTIVVGEPIAQVFAPLERFSQTLPLVIAVVLGIVVLTSSVHIRKCVVPLVKLTRAADRVARGHFDGRVVPDSGDEFDDFARSFNAMTEGLQHRFAALEASREIECEILSTLDPERIAQTVLTRLPEIAACDAVSVCVAAEAAADAIWVCQSASRSETRRAVRYVRPTGHERAILREQHERLIVADPAALPSYIDPDWRAHLGVKDVSVFPVEVTGDLRGVVALGRVASSVLSDDAVREVRQLTDQIAVALGNGRRMTELDELHWGTLTALSRTIDAKSPWTAGHSERVTQLALVLGRKLGLVQAELEVLRRGALLHDIGKVAVPARILDKDSELTPEEVEIMQQHARLGARILSPIMQYEAIVPIVAHHHERWDGSGYPDQLAGDEIPLLARVLAVPDMFDALTSSRPHRPGWTRREAMDEIARRAGTHLDPRVVHAFWGVMADRASGGRGIADVSGDLASASSV